MIEFYAASWATRIFITFLFGIGVIAQTLAIILHFYRSDRTIRRFFEHFFEVFILGEILILSLLHGEVITGYRNGIVIPEGYENARIIVFMFIIVLGVVVCFFNKSFIRAPPTTRVSLFASAIDLLD